MCPRSWPPCGPAAASVAPYHQRSGCAETRAPLLPVIKRADEGSIGEEGAIRRYWLTRARAGARDVKCALPLGWRSQAEFLYLSADGCPPSACARGRVTVPLLSGPQRLYKQYTSTHTHPRTHTVLLCSRAALMVHLLTWKIGSLQH